MYWSISQSTGLLEGLTYEVTLFHSMCHRIAFLAENLQERFLEPQVLSILAQDTVANFVYPVQSPFIASPSDSIHSFAVAIVCPENAIPQGSILTCRLQAH